MLFLRKREGLTLMDKKRNEDMARELNITPMIKKIKTYRQKWREHVDRVDADRFPKI